MSMVEGYLELLKEIYGADVVDKCIKPDEKGLLFINKKAEYFKKSNQEFAHDRCDECGKNLYQALPGWVGGLDFTGEHIRKYMVISENPEPDNILVTSYRVGLDHEHKNFTRIRSYLERISQQKFELNTIKKVIKISRFVLRCIS